MSTSRSKQQTEWLNLVEIAGPFLAGTVLQETFPQGLEKIETPRRQRLRAAYEEWQEAVDDSDAQLSELHAAWIRMVLEEALEYDGEVLFSGDNLPSYIPEGHDAVFTPDRALRSLDGEDLLFISIYPPETPLDQPLEKGWVASPIERMTQLCRSKQVRVGLVTNGEQWTLVNAPVDNTTGYTTWYARLWWQEPVTFKAFVSLLGVRRFFGPEEGRLDQLLERSLAEHHEVTDTLGEQVRRAVEVLVQALGRANEDRNGELLRDVTPTELYNAGLTVMMRLVFLLCAEERELLLLGDPVYDQHYAISTLRSKLRDDADQHGVEVLERRYDAWSRLLSVFRAVYGGVEHESLRMPAMGGSLFDPDRFPFLEGRAKETSWRDVPASPLPIDNRTVMLLLRALQVLEHRGGARQLSYRGLDVEQIGHVYEGLLEYQVERVSVPTLGLIGSKKVPRPSISLRDLEAADAQGTTKASAALAKLTGRSTAAVSTALKRQPETSDLVSLVHACDGDEELALRILPYTNLLRQDNWGTPLIYQAGSFAITPGPGRRESGAHYTPKALTEPIVETTLRPLLEAMGENPTSEQLLSLKLCDPAMGSGAFLVEVCRQIGGRLVEAWAGAEGAGLYVTVRGEVVDEPGKAELLSSDLSERLVTARRLVTERCLYGVDKNPMAVELAKLSLWLVTLAKHRPLGFLDHKLKHGDSLVGLTKAQIAGFNWRKETPAQLSWLEEHLQASLGRAFGWRGAINALGDFDYAEKKQVYQSVEEVLTDVRLTGDLVVAAFFGATKDAAREKLRSRYQRNVEAWLSGDGDRTAFEDAVWALRSGEKPVPPLHWEIEFPEVFERQNPGFDALLGNPPFLGGKRISTVYGNTYRDWLKLIRGATKGAADLCAYFFLRAVRLSRLTSQSASLGLIATNSISQGDTREVGLAQLLKRGLTIYDATPSLSWPGNAAVVVSIVHITRSSYEGSIELNKSPVEYISAYLDGMRCDHTPLPLRANQDLCSTGVSVYGKGFVLSTKEYRSMIESDPISKKVLRPYLVGNDINNNTGAAPSRWCIDFGDRDEKEAQMFTAAFKRVTELVKPIRDDLTGQIHEPRYWLHWDRRETFFSECLKLSQVFVRSRVSNLHMVASADPSVLISDAVAVYKTESLASFAVIQSLFHELWAERFSTTMKSDLRYSISDAFDNFPFPGADSNRRLEVAGQEYHSTRAAVLEADNLTLRALYNETHDRSSTKTGVKRLRDAVVHLAAAVGEAYGFDRIQLDFDFRRAPWLPGCPERFTVGTLAHTETLNSLLALHQKRREEEAIGEPHVKKSNCNHTVDESPTSSSEQEGLF